MEIDDSGNVKAHGRLPKVHIENVLKCFGALRQAVNDAMSCGEPMTREFEDRLIAWSDILNRFKDFVNGIEATDGIGSAGGASTIDTRHDIPSIQVKVKFREIEETHYDTIFMDAIAFLAGCEMTIRGMKNPKLPVDDIVDAQVRDNFRRLMGGQIGRMELSRG